MQVGHMWGCVEGGDAGGTHCMLWGGCRYALCVCVWGGAGRQGLGQNGSLVGYCR